MTNYHIIAFIYTFLILTNLVSALSCINSDDCNDGAECVSYKCINKDTDDTDDTDTDIGTGFITVIITIIIIVSIILPLLCACALIKYLCFTTEITINSQNIV